MHAHAHAQIYIPYSGLNWKEMHPLNSCSYRYGNTLQVDGSVSYVRFQILMVNDL